MWHVFVLILFHVHPFVVKSAWVEIPQLPSNDNKPAQFVFGTPKVSFLDQKFITTPPTHKMLTTIPKIPSTTLPNYNYKKMMTTTNTISPLTTTLRGPPINRRNDNKQMTEDTVEAPKIIKAKVSTKFSKNKNSTAQKEDTFSGFLPFLHSIQQTLTLNAKKSLRSKISLLSNLRDNLLANIDEQMTNLWRRSEDGVEPRGHDDHEMDFPSNEGALMTIGFLTFAVFLIKLVLKLIHALKNKTTTTTTGTTVMTGTTTTALIGRKKRELENYDALKILQFIDEYKFS